jgi:hypothetical protein
MVGRFIRAFLAPHIQTIFTAASSVVHALRFPPAAPVTSLLFHTFNNPVVLFVTVVSFDSFAAFAGLLTGFVFLFSHI